MGGDLVPDANVAPYLSGQEPPDPDDDVLKTDSSDELLTVTQNVEQPDEFEADPDAAYRQKWGLEDDVDRDTQGDASEAPRQRRRAE